MAETGKEFVFFKDHQRMFEKSPRPVKREMTIGDKVITVVSRVTFDSLLRLSALLVLQLRTIRATK